MEDAEFTNDMQSLLRPSISFNASYPYPLIYETIIDRMEGKESGKLNAEDKGFTNIRFESLNVSSLFLNLNPWT